MKFPKPARQSTDDREDLAPFLKTKDVGKVGKRAKLTIVGKARLVNSAYGEQVVVPVKHAGKEFAFGVKTDKPNYTILWDRLGDPNKWKGAIAVVVVKGMRGEYLAVE